MTNVAAIPAYAHCIDKEQTIINETWFNMGLELTG